MALGVTRTFTYQVTSANSPFVITKEMGIQRISIENISAITGTYLGTGVAEGINPVAVDIEEDKVITDGAVSGQVMEGGRITAPVGCTLQIIANI